MFKASVLAIVVAIGTLALAGSADAQRRPATNGAGFVPNGWCRGNGNPHAAECPIFAPGSTAPNNYNSNQPVPTTNQLPQPPQQPTVPSIPMTTLTPAMLVPPQPPMVVPPHTSQQIPPPIPGQVPMLMPPQPTMAVPPQPTMVVPPQQSGNIPMLVPLQTSQQIPPPIPGQVPMLVPPQPTMAVPPQQSGNIPQLKPGFVAYPHYAGPRDPNTGYPIPPQPTMAVPPQQPNPTMAVPPQQPGSIPQLKPGFVAYPHYVGPRDPNTGYPIPPQPTMAVPPQQPNPTMAVPPQQPGSIPQLKPGFVAYPHYVGPRDPNTGYPIPPQPTMAVPPQQPQPMVVAPPLQPTLAPQLKPGFVDYPNYVGPRDPNTGYPIPPQPTMAVPPQQPQPMVVAPPLQPTLAPQLKPGFVDYPNYVGPRDPNTGYPIPPQPTMAVPSKQPQPMVVAPPLQPPLVPQLQQVDVSRPRPLAPQGNPPPTGQASVVITPQSGGSHVGVDLVTAKSGRQAPNAVPVFDAQGTGDRWHCVASGHHVRKVFDDNGNQVYAGALPGVAIQVVPIIRDVPAWHDLSSECIISVREHPKATQARR